MAFFSVTSTMLSESGANVLMVFRPDDASIASLADFHEALSEDGSVIGVKWKFKGEQRRLVDPRRAILGLAGIVVVQEFYNESVDGAPEPDAV